jgi:multiphosphoryl transfer protein
MTTLAGKVLRSEAIAIGQTADDRAAAISLVGGFLVAQGYVTPAYVESMQQREAIVSTYLGNGISLPHGTGEAQETILSTGIAVAQFPAGVAWGDEPARLVIGVAARSDEHIGILSRLAGVLEDAALCERLGTTTDPNEILSALTSDPPPATAPRQEAAELERTVRIANPSGLHARPAAELTERVLDLDAVVRIAAKDRRANASSITQLIALGASVGDEVTVSVSGPDAAAAMDAVLAVLLRTGDQA